MNIRKRKKIYQILSRFFCIVWLLNLLWNDSNSTINIIGLSVLLVTNFAIIVANDLIKDSETDGTDK